MRGGRTWLVAGASALTILLVAGGAVILSGGGGDSDPAPVSSVASEEPAPSAAPAQANNDKPGNGKQGERGGGDQKSPKRSKAGVGGSAPSEKPACIGDLTPEQCRELVAQLEGGEKVDVRKGECPPVYSARQCREFAKLIEANENAPGDSAIVCPEQLSEAQCRKIARRTAR